MNMTFKEINKVFDVLGLANGNFTNNSINFNQPMNQNSQPAAPRVSMRLSHNTEPLKPRG